jgi:hypothetical protein
MLKHVGMTVARSIRFNGFSLSDIEFIRWNRNPPSAFILKGVNEWTSNQQMGCADLGGFSGLAGKAR